MRKFKSFFFKKKQKNDENNSYQVVDQYDEIGKLVKEARIQKNISIEELSHISKIPLHVLNSIENNIKSNRPEYPFIRSILFKLEKCLSLRQNILGDFLVNEIKVQKKINKKFIVRKFDLINTWYGNLLYFLILLLTIFILKRHFSSNITIIEIQNIENKIQK